MLYGKDAPRHSQRIYVRVSEKTPYLPPEATPHPNQLRRLSGMIIGGDWDLQTKALLSCPRVHYCFLHWKEGLAWKDTGCYEYLLGIIHNRGRIDGLRSLDDIKIRYCRLDELYKKVKKDGRLLNAHELGKARGRNLENKGILIHIGRKGEPIFGGSGCHRIAMAISLGIQKIPAKLGMVHIEYIPKWLAQVKKQV